MFFSISIESSDGLLTYAENTSTLYVYSVMFRLFVYVYSLWYMYINHSNIDIV